MQDLPKRADRQWREDAKGCLSWAQGEASFENACLKNLLNELELGISVKYAKASSIEDTGS